MTQRKKKSKNASSQPTNRVKLSAAESLKRLQEFSKRKENFVASVRKGKDRGLSA
jgi:hypothetical protein